MVVQVARDPVAVFCLGQGDLVGAARASSMATAAWSAKEVAMSRSMSVNPWAHG
jgi:hypothetical protein